jgi:hypothetical protein
MRETKARHLGKSTELEQKSRLEAAGIRSYSKEPTEQKSV